MSGLLQSFHVISPAHFEIQTAEDNLHVLWIIPLFLNYVSLNSCLYSKSRMNFSHMSLHPFLFSSTCSFLPQSNSHHQFHLPRKQHNCSRRLTPMPRHPRRWCTSAALLGGVCSANLNHIGWAHLWKQMSTGAGMLFLFRVERLRMAFRHSSASLPILYTVSQVPSRQAWPRHPHRKSPRWYEAGGRKHWSSGFTPCFVYFNISPACRW